MFRATAHAAVRVAVRAGIPADVFSYASIVAAAGAGLLFWQSRNHPKYLIVGVVLVMLRLWLNMFDGMVAVASGKASKKGEIINDLPDRISDILILGGMAQSGWCNTILAYWAALFALLVAYVGLTGQAAGVQREYSGMMSKPWRMVALSVGAVATCILVHMDQPFYWYGWAAVDWMHWLIIAGSVQTIVVRLSRIFGALDAK
jgi:phosphatidylglycerophosphate synthase